MQSSHAIRLTANGHCAVCRCSSILLNRCLHSPSDCLGNYFTAARIVRWQWVLGRAMASAVVVGLLQLATEFDRVAPVRRNKVPGLKVSGRTGRRFLHALKSTGSARVIQGRAYTHWPHFSTPFLETAIVREVAWQANCSSRDVEHILYNAKLQCFDHSLRQITMYNNTENCILSYTGWAKNTGLFLTVWNSRIC